MRVAKRILATAVIICFFAAFPIAEIFDIIHSNHAHDYNNSFDNCSICALIGSNPLKRANIAAVCAVFVFIALLFAAANVFAAIPLFLFGSLVNLKIRMNV